MEREEQTGEEDDGAIYRRRREGQRGLGIGLGYSTYEVHGRVDLQISQSHGL